MIDYYTDTMGLVLAEREKDRAFLATKIGQLVVQVNKADAERCTKLSFEVAPNADFGALARELDKDGIKSELRNDSIPGMGPVLSFDDCKGTTIELFKEWSYLGKHEQVVGVGPLKLGHVAFAVKDPRATAEFYEKVLGFRVSDWIGDFFVFMRCGPDHHTVNFIRGDNVKMHHIAFEVKDFMHLQNACELFGQRNIPIIWGPLRHGPGHNIAIYHRNPDEQVIEFFTELDLMKDEELGYFEPRPWHRDTPQRPKVWEPGNTSIWGPPPTPDFHRGRN
jgi:catechol 2,3-dioxygenase-like lactoylglutathione lyase family enzyme